MIVAESAGEVRLVVKTVSMEDDNMLTTGDVARILNIHVNTLRRWSKRGIIKSYRIGPRADRRFGRDEVASFLNLGWYAYKDRR